jgi:hypothetical protein
VEGEQRSHHRERGAEQHGAAVGALCAGVGQRERRDRRDEGGAADADEVDQPVEVHLLVRHEGEQRAGGEDPRCSAGKGGNAAGAGQTAHPAIIGS